VFLTVGVFAAGVAFWVAGTVRARDATAAIAEAMGVDSGALRCVLLFLFKF
jgi:hypothetical protein